MVLLLLVIASVVLVIAAVLAAPVEVAIRADTEARRKVHARLRLLFGAIRVDLGGARPSARPRPERRRRRRSAGFRRGWRVLTTPGIPSRTLRFVGRMLRAIRFGEANGLARIGLNDPADTGELWGIVGPVAALLAARAPGVRVAPDFSGESFSVRGSVAATFTPLVVLAVAGAFALSPPVLRAALRARRHGAARPRRAAF